MKMTQNIFCPKCHLCDNKWTKVAGVAECKLCGLIWQPVPIKITNCPTCKPDTCIRWSDNGGELLQCKLCNNVWDVANYNKAFDKEHKKIETPNEKLEMGFGGTISYLKEFFEEAKRERKNKNKSINGEPEWMQYERDVMLTVVNDIRQQIGKEPVFIDKIIQAERLAEKNVDYGHMFCVNCSKIVFDVRLI